MEYFRKGITTLGVFASHPIAFVIVFCYALAWLVFDPATLNWHGIATISTWFMTLLIQRAEHRDTQAIHAKLDELLKANAQARPELALLDEQEPEAIEEHRIQEHRELR